MKKKDPQNTKVRPHDAFFKESFSMLAIAKEYVLHFLPQAIVSKLDLDQMVLDNTTYITPELEQYYADLVWTCKYGKSKVRIAFLFEHKSKPEKYPHPATAPVLTRDMGSGCQEQKTTDAGHTYRDLSWKAEVENPGIQGLFQGNRTGIVGISTFLPV
jgi:hypothetical protein